MKRSILGYVLTVTVFVCLISGIIAAGSRLGEQIEPAGKSASALDSEGMEWGLVAGIIENLKHPVSTLFVQIIVVLLAARSVGFVFQKIGQPSVVGEMAAGLLLGPSFLGWVAPQAFEFIFPSSSLGTLRLLSQIGVCLFMFVVGMELNVEQLRSKAHSAVLISHVSILFPYFLGVVLALPLFASMAPKGVPFMSFALFLGIALSITAFPVLARILNERGLSKTPVGTMAITCAAVDDVSAWSILAFVIAVAKMTSVWSAIITIALAGMFVAVMLMVVKPLLARAVSPEYLSGRVPTPSILAGVLALIFCAALSTEVIGIHALFGAFLTGVIMPPSREFRTHLHDRLERFSSVLLLPLFFVFTGLRTQVGLLADWESWLWCLVIIGVATLGKLGGSMIAARWAGMNWNESFMLGALMNTRGLMELIALNIGYDLGILSPRIFTMMVLMALATTFMTGPLLSLASFLSVTRARQSLVREAGIPR